VINYVEHIKVCLNSRVIWRLFCNILLTFYLHVVLNEGSSQNNKRVKYEMREIRQRKCALSYTVWVFLNRVFCSKLDWLLESSIKLIRSGYI
jgi:hypothetical protein